MDKLERQKINIFSEVTTYNADFGPPAHMCRVEPANKPKSIPITTKVAPEKQQEFRDIETFYKFDSKHYVPFDLLWEPKDIIGTQPTETFENPVN